MLRELRGWGVGAGSHQQIMCGGRTLSTSCSASIGQRCSRVLKHSCNFSIGRPSNCNQPRPGDVAGGEEFANDLRIVRPNGETIWIHSRARGIRDADGRLVWVEGTDQDVTEMITAKLQLRSERDRFRETHGSSTRRNLFLPPDRRWANHNAYASPRIEPIYGISPSDLAMDASRVFEMIHADDAGRVHQSIAESARTLTTWHDEFRVLSPILGEIWIEGCSVPLQLDDGSILWHGYINDVTARHKTDEALRASERRLRLALEAAGSIAFTWDIPNDAVTRYFSTEPALPVTGEVVGRLADVRKQVHATISGIRCSPFQLPRTQHRVSEFISNHPTGWHVWLP